tara:strand:+ start:1575 stop:1733 length:159 start_codon:yes stop_codon:yes gene_type:complete
MIIMEDQLGFLLARGAKSHPEHLAKKNMNGAAETATVTPAKRLKSKTLAPAK